MLRKTSHLFIFILATILSACAEDVYFVNGEEGPLEHEDESAMHISELESFDIGEESTPSKTNSSSVFAIGGDPVAEEPESGIVTESYIRPTKEISSSGYAGAGGGDGGDMDTPSTRSRSLTKSSNRMRVESAKSHRSTPSGTHAFDMRRPKPEGDTLDKWVVSPSRRVPGHSRLTAGDWDDNLNFERFKNYVLTHQNNVFKQAQKTQIHRVKRQHRSRSKLDLMFLIDTTGSMGDEMRFITREITSIIQDIEREQVNRDIKVGAVLYKDVGDTYVTRTLEPQSVQKFVTQLLRERASGGGDYPEAMAEGLAALNQITFRQNANRMTFLFADAPARQGAEHQLLSALSVARGQRNHIYPVASSGVDETTELELRMIAQQTGGKYIFLTDDSGIGHGHKEPTIPCYEVRTLKRIMKDAIQYEMSGQYQSPDSADVIRSVGSPHGGQCMRHNQVLCIHPKRCHEQF